MFRAPLSPSSGALELYRWLLPMVLGSLVYRSLVWCGVVGYVSGMRDTARLESTCKAKRQVPQAADGFGGIVVTMLASCTQVRWFKPCRSRWIFMGVKILSMPSFEGEVKESVPCPSFAACQRT